MVGIVGTRKENSLTYCKKLSSNQQLMDELKISKGYLAIYKKKLSDEGLINVTVRGNSSLCLPRFDRFIQSKEEFVDD